MAQVTDKGFIVIDDQVAMPKETLCELLNVTPQRISELVQFVGMKYIRGGIYFRDGRYYFASPQVVFRMDEVNGTSSERLTQRQVYELFDSAEKRLLSRMSDEKLKKFAIAGIVLMAAVAFLILPSRDSSSSKSPHIPTKTEQATQFKKEFYSVSYGTLEKVTELRVTEKYNFSVREDSDEEITTYGHVEFENDGIRHPFWITFKKSTKKVLRVDIDTSVVYVADDW